MAAKTSALVAKFIKLDEARKKHEGAAANIKEELAALETELLARFERDGTASVKSSKGVTVYVRRDLWAGAAEGADVLLLECLKSVGLGDMVKEKVNTQTLSAYVREQEKTFFGNNPATPEELIKVLPEALQPALHLTEKFSLRTRKG